MITEVAKAVMDKYTRNTTLTRALYNGLFFQQAPQDTSGSYGVFYINGITRDEIMGAASNGISKIEIQFNLFTDNDDGGFEISTISQLLTDCFDWKNLYVEGYHSVWMQRNNILPLGYVDEMWQTTIEYELGIEKE